MIEYILHKTIEIEICMPYREVNKSHNNEYV